MKKITFFSLVLLSVVCIQGFAELTILSPPKLKKWWDTNTDVTKSSIAAFGYIPWGRKILGRLQLAEPLDACDYIKQNDADYLQQPILVALRGNCPFVTKAHYAQLAGAKMLIVVDDNYEQVEAHLMVDVMGQGESVKIPAVLMTKQGGDRLIDSLRSTDREINSISATFDFPLKKSNKVEYHVWLSSATAQSFKFLRDWQAYEQKIHEHATMVPHYAHFNAVGQESELKNSNDCICGGKYCAPDPDDNRDNTGADVLQEDLRQRCIYKLYNQQTWWKYVTQYDDYCLTGGRMQDCGANILNSMKVSVDAVNKCVQDSFDTRDIKTCRSNRFLDEEEKAMDKDGVFLFPSVIINGFAYRGNLVPSLGVFEAICETFKDMPKVCRITLREPAPPPTNAPILISALVFLVFFALFVFCCYRRYLKREMYKQMVRDVNIAVSQYIAFRETDTNDEQKGEI